VAFEQPEEVCAPARIGATRNRERLRVGLGDHHMAADAR